MPLATHRNRIRNQAGGLAAQLTPKEQLVAILLTSFGADKHYENAAQTTERLTQLISSIDDKLFVAKAAIFARREAGMRTISHIAAVEVARTVKGSPWSKRFFQRIVNRPDDMQEILALWYAKYGDSKGGKKSEPNAMKKGFAAALEEMSDYALAKYANHDAVSMVDVVNICHPRHTPALNALMKGTLAAADTWENALSAAGPDATNKAAAWSRLLSEQKLQYMALLKNVRNIMEQAPLAAPLLCDQLQNEAAIRRSLVLPFRFLTCIEQIEALPQSKLKNKVLGALECAFNASVGNVVALPGKTLVAVDNSGSMVTHHITGGNEHSSAEPMTCLRAAAILAAIIYKAMDADVMLWADDAEYVPLRRDDALTNVLKTIVAKYGKQNQYTRMSALFEKADKRYDRIIVLSDMQTWVETHQTRLGYNANHGGVQREYVTPAQSLLNYHQRMGAAPVIYDYDLQGYGNTQFDGDGVIRMAGFSARCFDAMRGAEEGVNGLMQRIEAVEL